MKPINEWTEADLQALVDAEEPESLTLEFKALRSLGSGNPERNELSKDVSAMANSNGGRIIYGIRETKKNGLPVAGSLDDDPDPPKITAESIEQRISGTIQPRPLGITIKAIPLQNGNIAFVLDIPQVTSNGPHQANDQKYYRRFNFQCVPMYDYEIRDILRRATTPELHLEFSDRGFSGGPDPRHRVQVQIRNKSSEPALYYTVALNIDRRMTQSSLGMWDKSDDTFIQFGGMPLPLDRWNKNHAPNMSMPIFKEASFSLCELNLSVPDEDEDYHLLYEIRCPGFEATEYVAVRRSGDGLTFTAHGTKLSSG